MVVDPRGMSKIRRTAVLLVMFLMLSVVFETWKVNANHIHNISVVELLNLDMREKRP